MKKTKKIVPVLAIAAGKETNLSSGDRYIGLGVFTLAAVNPTKAELSALFNGADVKDPVYTLEKDGVQYAKIDLYLKTVVDKCNGIDTIIKATYFLANKKRVNKEGNKIEVVNAYGDTAWVTQEEYTKKIAPEKMPNFSMKDIRPTFGGETVLVKFIKRFLGIPSFGYLDKNKNVYVQIDNPSLAECQLARVPNYFKGDFSEVKVALMARATNRVKLLCGAKIDNGIYQDVFVEYPVSYTGTNIDPLLKELTNQKDAGRYATTIFGKTPFNFQVYTPPVPGNSSPSQGGLFGDAPEEVPPPTAAQAPAPTSAPFVDDLPFGGSEEPNPFFS